MNWKKSLLVNKQLNNNYQVNEQKIVVVVASMVETIKFRNRQYLSLRNHRDSMKQQPKVDMSGSVLMNCCSYYRSHGGDTSLKHLESTQNVWYSSPETQKHQKCIMEKKQQLSKKISIILFLHIRQLIVLRSSKRIHNPLWL